MYCFYRKVLLTHLSLVSVNWVNIGSDNSLLSGQHQVIIWITAQILLIGTLEKNFSDILINKSYIFIQENAFENVVWDMAAILSREKWVKWYHKPIPFRYDTLQTATCNTIWYAFSEAISF